MTKLITIHNIETGKVVEREMTLEEIALENQKALEIATQQAKIATEQATKTAQRQAILDRLGLTADEAALLLGAN